MAKITTMTNNYDIIASRNEWSKLTQIIREKIIEIKIN